MLVNTQCGAGGSEERSSHPVPQNNWNHEGEAGENKELNAVLKELHLQHYCFKMMYWRRVGWFLNEVTLLVCFQKVCDWCEVAFVETPPWSPLSHWDMKPPELLVPLACWDLPRLSRRRQPHRHTCTCTLSRWKSQSSCQVHVWREYLLHVFFWVLEACSSLKLPDVTSGIHRLKFKNVSFWDVAANKNQLSYCFPSNTHKEKCFCCFNII